MQTYRSLFLILAVGATTALAACATTQAPAAPAPAAAETTQAESARSGPQHTGDTITAYGDVITDEAITSEGMFTTHRVGDRLFFEIPRVELDQDMIIMARQDEGGQSRNNRTVRWEQSNGKIHLRTVSFNMTASEDAAINHAVRRFNRGHIIAAFDIETFGADSAAVIDVTRLFTANIPEFVQVRGLQSDRTWIDEVRAFPTNVNVEAIQTGQNAPAGTPASTTRMSWSILKLPENPMMPRLHDSRVGIGSVTTIDYSLHVPESQTVRYVRRFRLEKQNPDAELSDPIEPIVFWVDPATPEWLVPWVVKGIEQWVPAYEEAGFTNAIRAQLAPTPEEDPTWSMHDARHSMIYWRPSTTRNATGGSTNDPRTGEILKAEVNMYHNVQALGRDWYHVQASPLDARAQQFPLPDSITGAMVEYVVAHEVGHAIGFPHNFKASAMYPVDSIRSRSFLERKGSHVATLMDYSRLNYVAQPEDSIPAHLLIPKVGPYDHFAVMWAHKPIPGANTPGDELATLDEWARMQDTVPWFRYTTPGASNDPHAVTEAVGNADAVLASTLGMRNLERVVDNLITATEKPGEDYSTLQSLYGQTVSQWGRYNNHVAALIGGAFTQEKRGTGRRFEPVGREEQEAAMEYLAENAFQVPAFFLNEDILRRIESDGMVDRFSGSQARVFRTLLNDARLGRLVEYEAMADFVSEHNGAGQTATPYTVADLMSALRSSVWGELSHTNPQVTVFRRSLQRVFISTMAEYLNPDGSRNSSDASPIVRAELSELAGDIAQSSERAQDRMTQLHLREMELEIHRILEPN